LNAANDKPILYLFRYTPSELLTCPPLASGLQSFETSLFLIGMHRYPAALVACATAWESLIKAKLEVHESGRETLSELLKTIRREYQSLQAFDPKQLAAFRAIRNRFVHFGFSTRDDSVSAVQLLETGFPFLMLLSKTLFNFSFDWKDVRPDAAHWEEISADEGANVGLLFHVAQYISDAQEVYRRSRADPRSEGISSWQYCFRALAYFIEYANRDSSRSRSENAALQAADQQGVTWEAEREVKAAIERGYSGPTYECDCPVCDGFETVVTELDDAELDAGRVVSTRFGCAKCEFFVQREELHLAEVALERELAAKAARVLCEYGIK
jgi:hypothetical protein